ncbi:MAG: deoxyribonuclease IV [Deltaproteobacteria bacterium]|nr:deoxyribonuclease IV [Deltaproteobacteria bacterium]
MPLGVHTSIAGHISYSIRRALELGCETMQIFSHSPRGWKVRPFDTTEIDRFKAQLKAGTINPLFVHISYLVNLASPEDNVYKRSIRLFIQEIEMASSLGANFVVTHLGSTKGKGVEFGVERVKDTLSYVLSCVPRGRVGILLENTAGSGWSFGHRFEDIGRVIKAFGRDASIGFCFDTCHGVAAGYPMRDARDVDRLVDTIDRDIGLESLRLIHLNDSNGGLGSRLDRHQHIGKGSIGLAGFRAIVNHPRLRHLPMIMETPKRSNRDDVRNLRVVRGLIKSRQ